MQFNIRRASIMLDITMPLAVILIFYPPCLAQYAGGLLPLVFLMQKGIFFLCVRYFISYKIFSSKYFIFMTGYVLWALLVTLLNGDSIGSAGNFLNLFSMGVITVFCIERNPCKYAGCIAAWFTLLLFFNTFLWQDGGMYVNSNGQASFVLGTKTSLTEYQLAACFFICLYHYLLPGKKWKAVFLWVIMTVSLILWNVREPITTSILCQIVFIGLLVWQTYENRLVNTVLQIGFWVLIAINIGIVFFNVQMLFANFITNVLHENADLNHRTAIWKLVLARITENPWIGFGLRSNIYFAVGSGVAGINQATHNGLLYFLFTTGIAGTAYLFAFYLAASICAGIKTVFGRLFHIIMICFATLWISEQLKGYDIFFLCMLCGIYISQWAKRQPSNQLDGNYSTMSESRGYGNE